MSVTLQPFVDCRIIGLSVGGGIGARGAGVAIGQRRRGGRSTGRWFDTVGGSGHGRRLCPGAGQGSRGIVAHWCGRHPGRRRIVWGTASDNRAGKNQNEQRFHINGLGMEIK